MNVKKYGINGINQTTELGQSGPLLNANGNKVEVRTPDNSALTQFSAADPISETDVVTKRYLEKMASATVVGEIYDVVGTTTGNPNVAVQYTMYLCTMTVGSFSINKLYYCTVGGSISGGIAEFEEVTPFEGMRISVGIALTNGTNTFTSDHVYLWDAQTSSWVDVGPAPNMSKVIRTVRGSLSFSTVSPLNIGNLIPAGSNVISALVNVTTAFNGTPKSTVTLGDEISPASISSISEVNLNRVGLYSIDCYVKYAISTQLIATYNQLGATQGSADIEITYSIP